MMNELVPDPFQFIDVILLSGRLGHIRNDEQRTALVAAVAEACDAPSFLHAIELRGISASTRLHRFAGEVLSALTHYRATYPRLLGLGSGAEPVLDNLRVPALVEPLLTRPQVDTFTRTYWWFAGNHHAVFISPRKGRCIGAYATDSKDNASVIARLDAYLSFLAANRDARVRARFDGFPQAMVVAVLQRAFNA